MKQREARRLGREAEALFRETLALDPGQAEAQLRLGNVLLDEGRGRDAEPVLRPAAEQAREQREGSS